MRQSPTAPDTINSGVRDHGTNRSPRHDGRTQTLWDENAYDEALATAVKRKHEPQHFVGDLLKAEISEKQARSIKYQLTIAKLPLAKASGKWMDIDRVCWNGSMHFSISTKI